MFFTNLDIKRMVALIQRDFSQHVLIVSTFTQEFAISFSVIVSDVWSLYSFTFINMM